MKKIVVTGSNGQLAKDIVERLREFSLSYRVYDFDRKTLDVTDKDALEKVFKDIDPDVWIQGASYHVVEEINSNPSLAADVNIASLHYIANLCNKHDTTLINFSTNYVFNGRQMPRAGFEGLEHYNEVDTPDPVNLYGILKYAGEKVVSTTAKKYFNVRVSGLFSKQGSRAKNGMCFPSIILATLEKNGYAEVVADQVINLTYTPTAARWLEMMIRKEEENLYGNYHFVNKGNHTWYDAARIMAKYIGQEDAIKKITTDDFYTNLSRPKWTPLNPTKFERAFGEGNEKIPTYEEDIQNYLREMGRIE